MLLPLHYSRYKRDCDKQNLQSHSSQGDYYILEGEKAKLLNIKMIKIVSIVSESNETHSKKFKGWYEGSQNRSLWGGKVRPEGKKSLILKLSEGRLFQAEG